MKSLKRIALFVGVVLAAPVLAHQAEKSYEPKEMKIADDEQENPQHEAFKAYVVDALDAHKNKAPKAMKGQHQEMKDYVGRALDGQKMRDARILSDTSTLDYKGSIKYIFENQDQVWGQLYDYPQYQKAGCENLGDRTPAQLKCLSDFLTNEETHICDTLVLDLDQVCTGPKWIFSKGSCSNLNFKNACTDISGFCNLSDETKHCSATPTN